MYTPGVLLIFQERRFKKKKLHYNASNDYLCTICGLQLIVIPCKFIYAPFMSPHIAT